MDTRTVIFFVMMCFLSVQSQGMSAFLLVATQSSDYYCNGYSDNVHGI